MYTFLVQREFREFAVTVCEAMGKIVEAEGEKQSLVCFPRRVAAQKNDYLCQTVMEGGSEKIICIGERGRRKKEGICALMLVFGI